MAEQRGDGTAATTEWIVIRPEGHIAGSELASVYDGEWRCRPELDRTDYLELASPYGVVRAFPTKRVELSGDGRRAQVWVVPGDTGVSDMRNGVDNPHQNESRGLRAEDRTEDEREMADYQSRTELSAPAQRVFDYLGDIANLPLYFERMISAEPAEGDAVRVTAELGDRQVEGQAWFKVDHDARALSWGSEGPNDYHGRLEVTDARGDAATVTVTLSTSRAAGSEIQQGLDETVANVKRVVEGA